ncbi:MAG: ATP-dependent RNA helicase [Deltaproteobacteria bacterium]|nr:ATP-dependent RNA helicase [Deltaproteobacteria bacterium]
MSIDMPLPIDAIRDELLEVVERGPVVVTAPTGSGKSTQVPRWCVAAGRVLVVEPRRVACRGLAQRVAALEGASLGDMVGYSVRDDNRSGPSTRILFATPGVVLRWLAEGDLSRYDTVILDEFHERRLDVDLLMALIKGRFKGRYVVMSATLDAKRVARHMEGSHLHAEGRVFPVTSRHVPDKALLPDVRGLEERVRAALDLAREDPGDVLIFLPGKAEIARVADSLRHAMDFEVLRIHGGLTLAEQSRVFEPGARRRIILTTNVAETSITIPGIGVVVDSGLVRRTRYVNGRGFLTLQPIAMDSADQRAGRAGRTAPGVSYRLWSDQAKLEQTTPPEIHREALAPLLLAAAACGARPEELPFLDPPKQYAVDSATDDLMALGVLGPERHITQRGRRLFGLPLDAPLGNLLVEAEAQGCIEDAIDLVAVLSVGRPLFVGDKRPVQKEDDLRIGGCDAHAFIRAIREGDSEKHRLSRYVLEAARSVRKRLRSAWDLPSRSDQKTPVRRGELVRAALRADPRSAYVARHRRGRVSFGNGGTEVELARESAVHEEKIEAIAVLGSMAVGLGYRKQRIYVTCAMPLAFSDLVEAGLGEDRVEHAAREGSTLVARIERVYAGKVIEKREEIPRGELARRAAADLFLGGRLFPSALVSTRDRLAAAELFLSLRRTKRTDADLEAGAWEKISKVQELEDWVRERFSTLGVETGEDIGLLSEEDLLAPELPSRTREWLDRKYPLNLKLGDAEYTISYDFSKREATLVMTTGKRKEPPALSTLPTLPGLRVRARHHSKVWVLRERR